MQKVKYFFNPITVLYL